MADDLLRDENGVVIPQQYEQNGQFGILTTTGSLYNGPINASLKRDRQGIVIPSQAYNEATGQFEMAQPLSAVSTTPMEMLLLFYGNPIEINGLNDVDKAAQIYAQYDLVVFNGGIEEPGSAFHDNTKAIVAKAKSINPRTTFFGYIHSHDPAVKDPDSSQPFLPIETVIDKIDKWKNIIGAGGIFLDAFGYDYEVSRNRQNELVTAVKNAGLPIIANSWMPDYVFSNQNLLVGTFYGNPDLLPCLLDENDYYLLENHVYRRAYYTEDDQEANDSERVYQAVYYRYEPQAEYGGKTYYEQYKTKTLSLNGLQRPDRRFFAEAYLVAIASGCHGFGMSGSRWGDTDHSHFLPPDVRGRNADIKLQSYTYDDANEKLSIETVINKNKISVQWDQPESVKSAYEKPNSPYQFYVTLSGTMNVNSTFQVTLNRVNHYPALLLGDTAEVAAQKIAAYDYGAEWIVSASGSTVTFEYVSGNPEFYERGAGGPDDKRGMYVYLNTSKGITHEYDVLSLALQVTRRITLNDEFMYAQEGITALRPDNPLKGTYYLDTTINKVVWWNGTDYVDALGTIS